jgi:hypothetical protein
MTFVTQQLDDNSFRIVDSGGNVVFRADQAGNVEGAGEASNRLTATATVARTDTTAKNLFMLPAGSVPLAVSIYSPSVSNATTTATVSVGITGTATEFVNAQDVKTAAGQLPCSEATNLGASVGTTAVQVIGTYAETGTASSLGGPYTVIMDYI